MQWFMLLVALLSLSHPVWARSRVDIGLFSQADTAGWSIKSFDGNTDYRIQQQSGQTFLVAQSEQSASAFYRSIKVDLTETPVLNWSWQKLSTLNPGDESVKQGDDFVARIYVIKKAGLLFWKTRAINYVWSYQHPRGAQWENPFAGTNAKMLSQRDATDAADQWFHEKRNIVDDFKRLHGIDIDEIDGVAIMTDSDNSGLGARAAYGDIYFSAE